MSSQSLGSLLVLLPLALAAQSPRERTVPLNNWPAPRHLPHSHVQAQRALTPKFQLPGGVTNDVLIFVPLAPCRLADTRPGSGYPALGSTPLASLTPVTLPVTGSCGVPSVGGSISPFSVIGPEAYSLNVTVVPPSGTPAGYLVVYPNPITPVPLAASLTWNSDAAFQTNSVITAASSDGSVNVIARVPTDVVIDINGYYAVQGDSGGNTALGGGALATDTVGGAEGANENTAIGGLALNSNNSGYYNTAVGFTALVANTDGIDNLALGDDALYKNQSGSYNTAVGTGALFNAIASNNTALGLNAGLNIITGNYNIMIGNSGLLGGTDDHVIRIGDVQTSTFIAGISGNTLTGTPVVINPNGQLGVETSSRRYKEDIQDMGDASKGLQRLRPVTFHYKKSDANGSKPLEYGLIAEEVADVYPDLVVRGQDGQIESVQYQKLPAMLLNELQKEHRNAEEQAQQQARHAQQQDETIKKLEARLAVLEAQLTNATAKVTSDKALPSAAGGR
jgi:hypothetical protein